MAKITNKPSSKGIRLTNHPFSNQVVKILREQVKEMRLKLDTLRDSAHQWGRHQDWPWNGFILSYSTFGGSDNWGKNIKSKYETYYAWKVLAKQSPNERATRFAELGNPRFRKMVSVWVTQSYDRIEKAGGPAVIRADYKACSTAQDRINFIRSFPGFDKKYGRNIPMDCYDELVCDHFALDHRLKNFLADCGYSHLTYRQGEALLRQLAEQLEVDAWTLDRVIYNRSDQIRKHLSDNKR